MDKARKRVLLHKTASDTQDSAGSVAEAPDGSPLLTDRSVSVEDDTLLHPRCLVVTSADHLLQAASSRSGYAGQPQATRLLY